MGLNYDQFLILLEIDRRGKVAFEELWVWVKDESSLNQELREAGLRSKVRRLRAGKMLEGILSEGMPARLSLFLTVQGKRSLLEAKSRFGHPANIETSNESDNLGDDEEEEEYDKSENMETVETIVGMLSRLNPDKYGDIPDDQNTELQEIAKKIITLVQDS